MTKRLSLKLSTQMRIGLKQLLSVSVELRKSWWFLLGTEFWCPTLAPVRLVGRQTEPLLLGKAPCWAFI